MKRAAPDLTPDGSVAEARKAYRDVLARHGLVNFSREEIDAALSALRSQHGVRVASGDIRFQAAMARLKSRKDLSAQAVEDALDELVTAECECDQAEWERDCHRWACIAQATFPGTAQLPPFRA